MTGVDFVAVPSTDWRRSRAFSVDTLGLRPDEHGRAEFWVGGTCFGADPDGNALMLHRRYTPYAEDGAS